LHTPPRLLPTGRAQRSCFPPATRNEEIAMTLQFAAPGTAAAKMADEPLAVLFDRDDTLIADVPYNGEPDAVEPVPGAREELQQLRRAGLKIGVGANTSIEARGFCQ